MATTVAKNTFSAMVKLSDVIEESTSEITDYGLVSHRMTLSHYKIAASNASVHLPDS